jgi:hypothetical protein
MNAVVPSYFSPFGPIRAGAGRQLSWHRLSPLEVVVEVERRRSLEMAVLVVGLL